MRRPAFLVVTLGMAVAVVLAPACSGGSSGSSAPASPNTSEHNPPGDIPDNQVFVDFAPPGAGFSVKVPEGWARSDADGASTFTDNYNSLRLEVRPTASAPSAASARRDELPELAQRTAGYKAGTVETVSRTPGQMVRITYGADSPVDPVTGTTRRLDVERYELWHDGMEIVLTLSGARGADNVDPWRIVTDSIRFAG
jgi:hypothetical protein